MARPRRIDWPRTFYHVLSRGNKRRPLFADDADYEKFLKLLGRMRERFGIQVWTYVLMGNHYHLVLKTEEPDLSRAMQWLGISYTSYFNQRWQRTGHLFQGRFKSFIIEEESYLRRLLLYIHRNPLRARRVERLADYPWSSYLCLAYGRGCTPWLEREKALRLYGGGHSGFRSEVQAYSEKEQKLLEDLRHGLLLGSDKVVKKVREKLTGMSNEAYKRARSLRRIEPLEDVLGRLTETLEISQDEFVKLQRPIRGIERPLRDVLIYLVWKEAGYRLSEIGKCFQVGFTSVVNARKRGEAYLAKHKKLQYKLPV